MINSLTSEYADRQEESHTSKETKINKTNDRTESIITKEVEELKEKIRKRDKTVVEILLGENYITP